MSYDVSIDLGRFLAEVNPQMYSDPLCVVDELVQNAQRAKARNLRTYQVRRYSKGDEVVVVEDDGCGLKDPNDLLRIARTGWDQSTVEEESPFGMGFWSASAFTSAVTVRSGTWALALNAHRLRQSKDIRQVVSVHETSEFHPGFTVELRSPRECSEWTPTDGDPPSPQHEMLVKAWSAFSSGFADKLASVVEFVPFESVRLASGHAFSGEVANRGCCADVPLKEVPCGRSLDAAPSQAKYARPVRLSFGQGVIWPAPWGWSPGISWYGVKFYLGGREVCVESEDFGGIVHVDQGALVPRAPDRKAFVANSAWQAARKELREAGCAMYRELCPAFDLGALVEFDLALERNLRDEDLLDVPVAWDDPKDASANSEVLQEAIPEGVALEHDLPSTPSAEEPALGDVRSAPEKRSKRMIGSLAAVEQSPSSSRGTTLRQMPDIVFWYPAENAESVSKLAAQLREVGHTVVAARTKLAARALTAGPSLREGLRVLRLGDSSWAPQMMFTLKPVGLGRHESWMMPGILEAAFALGISAVEVGEVYGCAEVAVDGILIPVGRPTRVSVGRAGSTVYLGAEVLGQLVPDALASARPQVYLAFRLLAPLAEVTAGKEGAIDAMDKALHTLVLGVLK